MSGSIASKNLYELLGNDPELDPERRTPEQPTKAIDKPNQRAGKRNAGAEGPVKDTPRPAGRGGRNQFSGNEGAFRDRDAGSYNNRSKPADDGLRSDRHPNHLRGSEESGNRGRGSRGGRGFGGRGGRGGRDDRHSRTGVSDHPKQAAHGWGGETGGEELADEMAGEAIAKQEEKEGFEADAANGEPAEPEDKSKSYDAYLAELAEKKAQLGSTPEVRKPNEGGDKKFPEGKAIAKPEDEQYFVGGGGKQKRERGPKEKQTIDLGDIYGRGEERSGFRGGRGGRGGRGRGEGRGGAGRGGQRGAPRGGAKGTAVNLNDQSAFPSLGA
ncbi:uncharacterized protein K452DRAFT_289701 [Aplosporella prunicola CBS 121167]|uniref:Hyaluronan/mRNA-binding protein domain-containing protein n=1 Tax=Aplosporella prunicola CBS 121167 TaxID=1176127 RepID=A0A6A6B928_9PEZI|nr:uncharacterized protein K452DRAFT_289701 [Aplosporella prunicola CBS 121167]KAF2139714.1 hypothetical protein K452DRAFT_289701 [Aplosporella prunicola CBS 121167]